MYFIFTPILPAYSPFEVFLTFKQAVRSDSDFGYKFFSPFPVLFSFQSFAYRSLQEMSIIFGSKLVSFLYYSV